MGEVRPRGSSTVGVSIGHPTSTTGAEDYLTTLLGVGHVVIFVVGLIGAAVAYGMSSASVAMQHYDNVELQSLTLVTEDTADTTRHYKAISSSQTPDEGATVAL